MSNFTKEMIDDYASKLLIGLTEEERCMIQEEFDAIENNMNLINEIPNIKEVEPLSYPFEMVIDTLRSDDEKENTVSIDELLQNCDKKDGREVEIPKVVG